MNACRKKLTWLRYWGICYSDREGESREVWDEEIDR